MKWNHLLLLFFLPNLLYAHTIIYKNLQVEYGNVDRQEGNFVYLKGKGTDKIIPKNTIAKIIIQDIKDMEALKKILKKVKEKFPPETEQQKQVENTNEIQMENLKIVLESIEAEEKWDKEFQEVQNRNISGWKRAAFFPGWGHIYLGHTATGMVYGTAFFVSLAHLYKTIQETKQNKEAYQSNLDFTALLTSWNYTVKSEDQILNTYIWTTHKSNQLFFEYETSVQRQKMAIGISIGIYVVQWIHAYYMGKKLESEMLHKKETELVPNGFRVQASSFFVPSENRMQILGEVQYVWSF